MKLRILAVVGGGFREARGHWRALLRALVVPAGVMSTLQVLAERHREEDPAWALVTLIAFPCWVLFPMACHRIVLLGEDALPNRWSLYWTAREWRFLGWSLLIGLITVMAAMPFVIVATVALDDVRPDGLLGGVTWLALFLPVFYVMARLYMLMPAVAVDGRPSLNSTWQLSRGNGWRLAGAMLIPGLMIGVPSWLVRDLLDGSGTLLPAIVVSTAWSLVGAVEVTVISVAYRTLTRRDANES